MPNPATSWWRKPNPHDAIKITNRPNGIAGALGFKRVIVTFNGVDSEPIWDVPPDDPLTTLQAGEQIEAYFKSLDGTKNLIIVSIDVRMDDILGGYDVTINTEEWIDQGFIPGDPIAPINNLDKDIETIIYDCDCIGFKQGNGVSFDSQDAEELGWKDCPCCHKPFKTRTSRSASYASSPLPATLPKFSSYLPKDCIVTSAPTNVPNLTFAELVKNWKLIYGKEFTDVLKTPEFREALAKAVKDNDKDPYKSGGSGPYDD